MKLFRKFVAGLVASGMLALGGTAGDEPAPLNPADVKAAEIRGSAVTDLGLAADLAAFARDAKSPESLVIAGGMLLRAEKTFGGKLDTLDAAPTDAKGTPIKGEAVKSGSLKEQAEALYDEARLMVSGDKAREASLKSLIENSKKFGIAGGDGARAAVGGPKRIVRVLNGGETHTYPVAFVGGLPAAVAMTSTGPARITFDLSHVGGNNLINIKGLNAAYNWVPARDKDGAKRFNITLTNNGRNPTTYTLVTN